MGTIAKRANYGGLKERQRIRGIRWEDHTSRTRFNQLIDKVLMFVKILQSQKILGKVIVSKA